MATPLRALTIEDPGQLGGLREQWDRLAVLNDEPYCAPAWMLAWWRHVAPAGARLRIAVVLSGDELVALAPLFLDRGPGGVRRLRLLASGTSSPLNVLSASRPDRALAGRIARQLADGVERVDVIMLEGIRHDSPWPALLQDAWPAPASLARHHQYSLPAPVIATGGGDYEHWFDRRGPRFRRNMRRAHRQVAASGGSVALTTSYQELAIGLEAFVALHRARWSTRGGSGVLDVAVEAMLLDAARELSAQNRLRLWTTSVTGRAVAAYVFVCAGGRASAWLSGFDPSETRIEQPAMVTALAAIEHSFRCGERTCDFGAGAQWYKWQLTSNTESHEWILLVRRGWRAPIAAAQLLPTRMRVTVTSRLSLRTKRLLRRARARLYAALARGQQKRT